ncbi:hypothetical protein FS837_002386 [Tulasnella sp. UAMH 9824]|nr:hypothetical protein FS837_002386 [Tulasnella sp. UAMH 9824]
MGQGFSVEEQETIHSNSTHLRSSQQQQEQERSLGGGLESLTPLQESEDRLILEALNNRAVDENSRVPRAPNIAVNGASQGRDPPPAAAQPTSTPVETVTQVGGPRLKHQTPVTQHQQQQPPYGGWQPQYPQYPYMNTEWYPHIQHPQLHQHPHQPFASALPPTQQPPTPANTRAPRTGPMPVLHPQASSPAVPHPGAPQINTNLPPSVPSTPVPAPVRPSLTTPLTAGAREFVPSNLGGSSPMIPSPGFPLPKKSNAIKISNPNTGEAVVLRPPDGGHSRTLSRDTTAVHESSPLRKAPIRMETREEKQARREKEEKEGLLKKADEFASLATEAEAAALSVVTPAPASPRLGSPSLSVKFSGSIGLGLSGFPGDKGSAPFVMGNFSSTPSRTTSGERFAASDRDKAFSGSGFIGGGGDPMGRSSSQDDVDGIGGPNAVPPGPRERKNRTDSQRENTENDSLKANAPQPSHQQQQQAALGGLEPVAPLQQSPPRWTPAAQSKLAFDENSPEYVERKVKALLNKLISENFDSISNQIVFWANKSQHDKNGATIILVIKLVFEKAVDEEVWSEMYARLCRKMMEQISQNVQDENIRNSAGELIVGGNLFRKHLLNRCQEDFERGWSQKESARAAAALEAAGVRAVEDASKANGENNEPILYSDEYYTLLKARRQGLGLVRFIGELFKLQMLTERIMHECVRKLVSKIENPEEEEIESLCKLLTTIGQALDTPKAKRHMDIYFGRMQMLADNLNVASRIRFMLLDVIELRQRNWRPRIATAGPSMISQVRERDAKEKAASAQQVLTIVPGTRGGWQRAGRGQLVQGSDGWNVAGPTPVRGPAKPGDLSNFGKFTASTGPLKTMGPSSPFKQRDRGRDTPLPGSSDSISRATLMYSLLGAGGADADTMPKRTSIGRGTTRKPNVDQAPQQAPDLPLGRKLNLLPRIVSSTNTTEDSAGDDDKPENDEEQAPKAWRHLEG